MRISIRFFAELKKYAPDHNSRAVLEVASGASAADILTDLGLPADKPKVVLINGRAAGPQAELSDGDEMVVFPPVEGG